MERGINPGCCVLRVQQSLGFSLSLLGCSTPAGSSRLNLRFTSRERVAAAPPHHHAPAGLLVGLGLPVWACRCSCSPTQWCFLLPSRLAVEFNKG
ncbi:hypothetical protein LEMLEM_LOCUS4279 [Lemmus lemmus]